jgi:hypothetical protein
MTTTTYFGDLDGFHNVTIICTRAYGLESVKFRWIVDCDEFVYKSNLHNNWTDQLWKRAKAMYKTEVKNVVQP